MDKKYEVDRTVWKSYRVPNKHFDEQPLFFSSVQLENDAHFVSSFDMISLMYYVVFLLWFRFYHVYITNLPQTTKNRCYYKGRPVYSTRHSSFTKTIYFLRPWNLFTSSGLEFVGFRSLSNTNWSPALFNVFFNLYRIHSIRKPYRKTVRNCLRKKFVASGLLLGE